jgi:hypothetical protein
MLLHHLYGHLSQRVPYGGYWQERTMKIHVTNLCANLYEISKEHENEKAIFGASY